MAVFGKPAHLGIVYTINEADDPVRKSFEITVRTIEALRGLSNGVHIMTIIWEDKTPPILDTLE